MAEKGRLHLEAGGSQPPSASKEGVRDDEMYKMRQPSSKRLDFL